ncbi:unnamed protein product [Allacma fusca]|uniref:Uncharacterized protein n=1 Tax=Allacma fusca TaxID=39272 RepID=A0A8J2IZC8_9HEXA|nr:unnamed protein product [Allacma fusca]
MSQRRRVAEIVHEGWSGKLGNPRESRGGKRETVSCILVEFYGKIDISMDVRTVEHSLHMRWFNFCTSELGHRI